MKRLLLIIALCGSAAAQEFNLEPPPSRISCQGTAACRLNGNVLSINVPSSASSGTPYIDPTNPLWGAKGDCVTDDAPVFQTIANTLRATGGDVYIPRPSGSCYKIGSTIQWAPGPGQSTLRTSVFCAGGYRTTILRWFGADQGTMFVGGDSTNYGAFTVAHCGFEGSDSSHRPVAIGLNIGATGIGNGVSHEVVGNWCGNNVFTCIRAVNTWLGNILFNRAYTVADTAIEFGPAGNGPVIGYHVVNNELACYGKYGIHSWATGSGGSNANYYNNDIECTMPTTIADVDVNDSDSFFFDRLEIGQGPNDPSYFPIIVRGPRNEIHWDASCIQFTATGNTNTIYGKSGNLNVTCPAPNSSFQVVDNGGENYFFRISSRDICTGTGCSANHYIGGYRQLIDEPGFTLWRYLISGQNWNRGRITFLGQDFFRSAVDISKNPPLPTDILTTAPQGSLVMVTTVPASLGGSNNNSLYLRCNNPAGCTSGSSVEADFDRMGDVHNKTHCEATSAPASGKWNSGDFCYNTAATEQGTAGSKYVIFGWYCTVGGTPCATWLPMRVLTGN